MERTSSRLADLSEQVEYCSRLLDEAALSAGDPQLRATLLQRSAAQHRLACDLACIAGTPPTPPAPPAQVPPGRPAPAARTASSPPLPAMESAARTAQANAAASGTLLRELSSAASMPPIVQYTLARCYESATELEWLLRQRLQSP